MNIVFKSKAHKNFADVKHGQVFVYEDEVYMRIYGRDGSISDAVDLSDGNVYHFDEDDEVYIVDATLNIDFYED